MQEQPRFLDELGCNICETFLMQTIAVDQAAGLTACCSFGFRVTTHVCCQGRVYTVPQVPSCNTTTMTSRLAGMVSVRIKSSEGVTRASAPV